MLRSGKRDETVSRTSGEGNPPRSGSHVGMSPIFHTPSVSENGRIPDVVIASIFTFQFISRSEAFETKHPEYRRRYFLTGMVVLGCTVCCSIKDSGAL